MNLEIQKQTSREIAAASSAALAKATIEAKFAMALHPSRQRSVLLARSAILDACKRPAFANEALYSKPVGGTKIEGLSIRFAEHALNAWKNVDVQASTAWEDDSTRILRVTVTDLESNLSYCDEVSIGKTVERKSVRDGQEVIGERETSRGEKVFIVRATEDELANKVNSAKSKAIRNSGLRLIPQDILEEAEVAIRETRARGGEDPKASVKKISDAFGCIGVSPLDLAEYLGHPLEQTTPKELVDLRSVYTAIKDGDAKWSDFVIRDAHKPDPKNDQSAQQSDPAQTPPGTAPQQPEPSQQLSDVVTSSGFTFDDFREWCGKSGHITDTDSLSGFQDISPTVAKRIMRIKVDMLRSMTEAKRGAAQ